jgi:DNA modification methylase
MIHIVHDKVEDFLPDLDENSFDGCFCDPPYGLGFMGKLWDHGVPGKAIWEEVLRVLKPGAMLLAFGGTRTHHRLMCAIEDAGFEVRDCLMCTAVYPTIPKSW